MHQNIAGFLSKRELLEITLYELSTKLNHSIDLLCLSETFVKKGHELNIQLKGYNLGAVFCRLKQKRGGVCILHNNSLEVKQLSFISDLSSEFIFECCGIDIVNYNIIIVCIYRIPGTNTRLFFERFIILLDKLKSKTKKHVILTGDWNIDTLKDTVQARELKDLLESYNFDFHIHVPTRQGACLDHFVSNIEKAQGYTIPVSLSDHETAQILTVPVKNRVNAVHYWYKTVRDYCSENIEQFKHCLLNYSWSEVFNCDDVQKAFDYFHTELCLLYNLCFPKHKVKISNKKSKPNWLTKGLRTSCSTKRKLRINYYKKKTTKYKNKYRTYAKLLNKCIIIAQKSKSCQYIKETKNKCRATWNVINENQCNAKLNTIDLLAINNSIFIKSPTHIASTFNEHFINIPKIATDSNIGNYPGKLKYNNATLFLTPTDDYEIKNVIKSLNNTSSTGYDEISTKVIKACLNELSPILSQLVNLSFAKGTFPASLKFSLVKPLYKKGERSDINNYRPITLIPVLSKIFEKVFHKRLLLFCNKFKIICPEQHGFQKGKSTSAACYKIIQHLASFMDKRTPVTMILFDLSRAFDYVCHETLLKKLETYGVRGHAHDWIESYLSGREQRVEISNLNGTLHLTSYLSNYCKNKYGVPQGSILGPLLFILYINDLPSITQYRCTLFADDISIIINKIPNTNYEDEINNTIINIIKWLNYNNLCVNLSKTKYIQFYNKNGRKQSLFVRHDDEPIEECTTVKFLGIYIDANLTWKGHVTEVCKKINRFTYALYRLTKLSNQDTALVAYHGYVCSTLRYGLVLWGNSVDVNRAFLIQKRCIRAICGVGPMVSCRPLFKKLKLLTLPAMYIFDICIFTKTNIEEFKMKHEICNFSTRYPNRLVAPSCSTTCYQKNCYYMSIKIFNKIPDSIKNLPINKFKTALFKLLCEECFYSIDEFLMYKIKS